MRRRQDRPQGGAVRSHNSNGHAAKQAVASEILARSRSVKATAAEYQPRSAQSPTQGIFAGHAMELRSFGLAVLPADGKAPCIKGYRGWRGPPSPKVVEQLAERFPDANIAILPGLSNLLIADVDTVDQIGEAERLLGRTPLHVRSSRGAHLYYRHRGGTRDLPHNLAGIGLKVDLKAGNSIVIAPPSRHESGAIYRHDGCDWRALDRLPELGLDRLGKVIGPPQEDKPLPEGRRGLGLNNILCRHAAHCDTFDELLDVARTVSANACDPPLPDSEVVKRARQVWQDAEVGKLEAWVGRKAVAQTDASEIEQLCAMGRNGADAVTLLLLLRAAHGARCRRGEAFCLVTKAMQRAQCVPGWDSRRYTAARDLLLDAGKLVQVSGPRCIGTRRVPGEYKLAEAAERPRSTHLMTPSRIQGTDSVPNATRLPRPPHGPR